MNYLWGATYFVGTNAAIYSAGWLIFLKNFRPPSPVILAPRQDMHDLNYWHQDKDEYKAQRRAVLAQFLASAAISAGVMYFRNQPQNFAILSLVSSTACLAISQFRCPIPRLAKLTSYIGLAHLGLGFAQNYFLSA